MGASGGGLRLYSDTASRLTRWLEAQDRNLVRFAHPVPLSEVSSEAGKPVEGIRTFLRESGTPVYHVWEHVHGGRTSRSKPYCLHLSGPDEVCLDWEDSVVGALEAEFRRRGYATRQQIGSPEHLAKLSLEPSLAPLTPGSNLRDFWALRQSNQDIDLWILEAKGKEAFEFDFYCFAEALGQVFPVEADLLSIMLGTKRRSGHGICWNAAQHFHAVWTERGYQPTITVGVVVPEWSPDIVWSGGKIRSIGSCFYARPLTDFRHFLAYGTMPTGPRMFKARQAFGQMLDRLETTVKMRSLATAAAGLRFRLLTTTGCGVTGLST